MNSDNIEKTLSFLQKCRRAYVRFVAELPVSVIRESQAIPARMRNLSAGGMLVEIEGMATVGDQFACEMQLPGMEPVVIPVEVRWFVPRAPRGTTCGVKFLHLPEKVFKAIVELSHDANLHTP